MSDEYYESKIDWKMRAETAGRALAEARARLTDLVVWAEWMKKRHRTPEMGQPNTGALGAAQAWLAARPAPAGCGHGVQFSNGACMVCYTEERLRADPRPAPAECDCRNKRCKHRWVRSYCPECHDKHVEACSRADPRPVPHLCHDRTCPEYDHAPDIQACIDWATKK